MTPLLFIIILTGILVILVYWVLSTPNYWKQIIGKRGYFETAQKLHINIKPDAEPGDILQLTKNDRIIIKWNLENEAWNQQIKRYLKDISSRDILIRVYDPDLNFFEIPADAVSGTYSFDGNPDTTYYAVIGIKSNNNFLPLFLANVV
jgi:hypothetical protein